jgi:hypothetical protein
MLGQGIRIIQIITKGITTIEIKNKFSSICNNEHPIIQVAYVIGKMQPTDRHGQVQKVFFTHTSA